MTTSPLSIPNHFHPALAELLTAFDYAQDSGADAWQFAIELSDLLATGATLADLRWLILKKFAEHAKETTIAGDPARTFRPLARTSLPDDACVLLTTEGASAIRSHLDGDPQKHSPFARHSGGRGSRRTARGVGFQPATNPFSAAPHYDAMLHELRLGDEIVKRFTRPAPTQELILKVFEEESWPPAIDDPLTSKNQDPKRHLHYTIRNLNRGQDPLRIRFYINGNGETIRWEIVARQREERASAPMAVAVCPFENNNRMTRVA